MKRAKIFFAIIVGILLVLISGYVTFILTVLIVAFFGSKLFVSIEDFINNFKKEYKKVENEPG